MESWVTVDSILEVTFLLWGVVQKVHRDVERYLRGSKRGIVGKGICYEHFSARSVSDVDVIVLEA